MSWGSSEIRYSFFLDELFEKIIFKEGHKWKTLATFYSESY